MESYREFWTNLILGGDGLYPQISGNWGHERFFTTIAVFAVFSFMIGIASIRIRFLAAAATLAIFAAYAVALVPFMVQAWQCGGCEAWVSSDASRGEEFFTIFTTLGVFFTSGMSALWLGVLLANSVADIVDWHRDYADDARTPEDAT